MKIDWQAVRHYAYLALMVAQPILLFYGLSSEQEVTLWATAITTVFGLGAAAKWSSKSVVVRPAE